MGSTRQTLSTSTAPTLAGHQPFGPGISHSLTGLLAPILALQFGPHKEADLILLKPVK